MSVPVFIDDEKSANIYDLLAKNGADVTAVDKFGKSARYAFHDMKYFHKINANGNALSFHK